MIVSFQLEPHLGKAVPQVYTDLTRTDLLRRCLKGKTQNPNEIMYSRTWSRLSMSKLGLLPTARYSIAGALFDTIMVQKGPIFY